MYVRRRTERGSFEGENCLRACRCVERVDARSIGATPAADPGRAGRGGTAPERVLAHLPVLAVVDDEPAYRAHASVLPGSNSAVAPDVAAGPRSRVIKIWLAQPSRPLLQSQ